MNDTYVHFLIKAALLLTIGATTWTSLYCKGRCIRVVKYFSRVQKSSNLL